MNHPNPQRTYILSVLLLVAGSLQMAGYVFKMPNLKGLGFSFGASPLPTVFSTIEGVEGFDTQQALLLKDARGMEDTLALNNEIFANFRGSFFLKNAYSIFLAYSHILTEEQREAANRFMLCQKNIFSSFAIKDSFSSTAILTQRTIYGRKGSVIMTPKCNE